MWERIDHRFGGTLCFFFGFGSPESIFGLGLAVATIFDKTFVYAGLVMLV
jgi:hypothetical protein